MPEDPNLSVPDSLRQALADAGLGLEFAALPPDQQRALVQQVEQGGDVRRVLEAVRANRVTPVSEESAEQPAE